MSRTIVSAGLFLLAAATAVPSVSAQVPISEYGARRAALAERIGDGLLLAVGSEQPPEDYINFFQNSPFRYLTGFLEPNAVLIGIVEDSRIAEETLFVNPRDPARETWEGYRVGPEGVHEVTGIQGRDVGQLSSVVDSLVSAGWDQVFIAGTYDLRPVSQRVGTILEGHPDLTVRSVDGDLAALRGVKSAAEIDMIQRAADITSQAHLEWMGLVAPGVNEFEGQALIEYTFRRYGSERPAFASIVGSGPNSTVLHYNANDRYLASGDVVVTDIGASYAGYSADITRTLPVDGRFTSEQREIYELVLEAQKAAEEIARPGVSPMEMGQTAATVLAYGLTDLGLIENPNASYQDETGRTVPQYFLYYMHALGHGLGLDVHDPWPEEMEPGVVFTIEPGVYVRPNLFTEVVPDTPANRRMRDALMPAFERYVGIGVRIEDDYVITEDGVRRISSAPREIADVEAAMAGEWSGPESRNADWVEWYRALP